MATFRISGIKEIQRAFDTLGRKTAGKVVRQSIRSGLKLVKAAAVRLAPQATGLLKRSIKVRASAKRKRGVISLIVITGKGDFKGDTYYGAFQEYGTKDMPGKRYMTRAFDETRDEVIQLVTVLILEGIEREAGK